MARSCWWQNRYYTSGGGEARDCWIGTYYVDEDGLWDPTYDGVPIMGTTKASAQTMANALRRNNPNYPYANVKEASTPEAFVQIFIEEAKAEGVRADVAFAQSMKETGWLKFGGQVDKSQYNFAGLGATDDGASGAKFPSIRIGIRAQIQHLKAYASTDSLNQTCVDPRFHLITGDKRGCAPIVDWLGIQENPKGYGWASGKNYGKGIISIMQTYFGVYD